MATVYLSLGSNLGDRRQNLTVALWHLAGEPRIIIQRISPFINTKPYGVENQPDFLNACVGIFTDFSPSELLARLKTIEKAMGRVETERWGERVIDIDILLYDDLVIDEENLHIPHADMANRAFVLEPLCEIAADAVYPRTGEKIADLLKKLKES